MKIPVRFKLLGQTIDVIFDKDLDRRENILGRTKYIENKIFLQPVCENISITQECVEDTFFHELLHVCLDMIGRKDLSEDERFIRIMAGLLHQVWTTAEYKEGNETQT